MISTVGRLTSAELTSGRITGLTGRDVSTALNRPAEPRGEGGRGGRSLPDGPVLHGARWACRVRLEVALEVNTRLAIDSNNAEFTF